MSNRYLLEEHSGVEEKSDLAHIEVKSEDPMDLFRMWHQEAKISSVALPNALCLSTVSKDGKVSARTLYLRRLDDDGFVIMTDKRGRKAQDMNDVPSAAMTFLWGYTNDRGEHIARQVKIEGIVKQLPREEYQNLYDREPLYCKMRSHVCLQGHKVEWDELKLQHDQLLKSVRLGEKDLPMPEHVVAYKLTPRMMEFYFASDHLIGDRVLFNRELPTDSWNHHHIAA